MEMTAGMLDTFGFFECLLTLFSWGLSYNLYADRLLGTNIFPQSVYDMRKVIFGATSFPHSLDFQRQPGTPLSLVSGIK